jgi:hypothetical protein
VGAVAICFSTSVPCLGKGLEDMGNITENHMTSNVRSEIRSE